jgi:hypothetical protein
MKTTCYGRVAGPVAGFVLDTVAFTRNIAFHLFLPDFRSDTFPFPALAAIPARCAWDCSNGGSYPAARPLREAPAARPFAQPSYFQSSR